MVENKYDQDVVVSTSHTGKSYRIKVGETKPIEHSYGDVEVVSLRGKTVRLVDCFADEFQRVKVFKKSPFASKVYFGLVIGNDLVIRPERIGK